MKKMYTVKDVAKELGKSTRWVYDEIEAGRLHPQTRRGTSKPYIFYEEDLNDWQVNSFVRVKQKSSNQKEVGAPQTG